MLEDRQPGWRKSPRSVLSQNATMKTTATDDQGSRAEDLAQLVQALLQRGLLLFHRCSMSAIRPSWVCMPVPTTTPRPRP